MYSQRVLALLESTANVGELPDADMTLEHANPACGDTLRLSLKVGEGRIEQARYRVQGCVAAIACAAHVAEWSQGRTLPELAALTPEVIKRELGGLPAASAHAASLAVETLHRAAVLLQSKSEDAPRPRSSQ